MHRPRHDAPALPLGLLAAALLAGAALAPAALASTAPTTPTWTLSWGGSGTGPGQIDGPVAVATDGEGNVYVAELLNSRVEKFDRLGNPLLRFGSAGSGPGQFQSIGGVAVDAAGNVYTSERNGNRVQKFTGSGVFVQQWGGTGAANGQFNHPQAVAIDADVGNDDGRQVRVRSAHFRGLAGLGSHDHRVRALPPQRPAAGRAARRPRGRSRGVPDGRATRGLDVCRHSPRARRERVRARLAHAGGRDHGFHRVQCVLRARGDE